MIDAFISFVDHYSDKRSGLERRIKDVGHMEEKRDGVDRREGFRPINKPRYLCNSLDGIFDQFMSDHSYGFPLPLVTDGERIIKAPFKIMRDWLGYDFTDVDLNSIYIDLEVRKKVLLSVKENEFTRFFPLIRKANGSSIVLDVLITVKTDENGNKKYYCFVDIED